MGEKILIQGMTLSNFINSLMHRWGVPFLHMALWGGALMISQNMNQLFPESNEYKELILFGMGFATFFFEILIVLIDIYTINRANYIAPFFIIFAASLLLLVLATACSVVCGIIKMVDGDIGNWIGIIILSSSILKLIENLLTNNPHWYVVTKPNIYDARGKFRRRTLK